jgi:hypothetical protein
MEILYTYAYEHTCAELNVYVCCVHTHKNHLLAKCLKNYVNENCFRNTVLYLYFITCHLM